MGKRIVKRVRKGNSMTEYYNDGTSKGITPFRITTGIQTITDSGRSSLSRERKMQIVGIMAEAIGRQMKG